MTHDKVVTDCNGHPLFRIQHRRSTIALLLPSGKVSSALLSVIEDAIVNAFEGDSTLMKTVERPQSKPAKQDELHHVA